MVLYLYEKILITFVNNIIIFKDMEWPSQNNINLIRGADEKSEESVKIQTEYLANLENYFKSTVEKRKLPEAESGMQTIFGEENKPPAFIDRIHKPPERKTQRILKDEEGRTKGHIKYNLPQEGYQRLWLVVDFDDTLNKTSSYHENLRKNICALTDMEPETFNQLYNEAKKTNQEGKKVLNFYSFIEEIKKRFPEYEKEISNVVEEESNSDKYLDQSVKRSLLAIRASGIPIRISILTFGDIKYQQARVNKTDLKDVVDDIIYTEGGKGEVLEKLMNIDYRPGIKHPFVITVDDSPEQVDDLDKISLKSDFVNVHFRNPQAKRFKDIPNVRNVPVLEEKPNEAAVNLYKLMRVCLKDEMQLTKQNIYKTFNSKDFGKIYSELNNESKDIYGLGDFFKNETNVIYENKPNGDMIRKSDYFRYGKIEHAEEIIGKDGKLFEIKPFGLSHSPISREEFIRGTD